MEIYTDGSCLGNPGPGGWAVLCSSFTLSGGLPHTTNNAMELTGALKALEKAGSQKVVLYTDSCYVKNGITKWILNWKKNGWKTAKGEPIKNQELWVQLDNLNGPHVTWKWVRAHNGNPQNEAVDKLAREQATLFANTLR
jgi:ribonuclease HI